MRERKEITKAIVKDLGNDHRDTFKHFLDTENKIIVELSLVLEEIKHLDTLGMVINTVVI